jgi:hypothetical protein
MVWSKTAQNLRRATMRLGCDLAHTGCRQNSEQGYLRMKLSQNDLIFSIVAIVLAIGATVTFFFTKREPIAPQAPTAVVTTDPALPPSGVQFANSLPTGGNQAGGMGGPMGGGGPMGAGGGGRVGGPPMGGGGMAPSLSGATGIGGGAAGL